jgi:hypothetical protein
MYLSLNEKLFEVELVNTHFAQYWHDWLFLESDKVDIKINELESWNHYLRYRAHVDKLKIIIDANNEIVTKYGLHEFFLYEPITNTPAMSLLSATHEKWAYISKKTFEFDQKEQEIINVYELINSDLIEKIGKDYAWINPYVHDIEFEYKFFYMHNANIMRPEISRSYKIKDSDTSFKKELISLPYYDIGRPQFEKYQITGEVFHPEISNYITIVNSVHFTSSALVEEVPKSYHTLCSEIGSPVFGNYVPICKNKMISPYSFGEFICQNLLETGNNFYFLKG